VARAVSTLLKKKQPRGDRGLESADLLEAALALMERSGSENFSLRAAAREIGCDAAALIYHFGSREGLERAIADRLHAGIVPPPPSWIWRDRLSDMARQYRSVAQSYPRTFPLLMRYWTTGPQDLRLCDETFAALSKCGIPDHLIPAAECGFYAALLGLCAGEAGGLTGRPGRDALLEIKSTPGLAMMQKLMPAIRDLGADIVFETQLMAMLDGLEALARRNRAKPRAAGKRKAGETRRKRA
jgi:AcrR family transcriptional regulator